MNIPPKILNKRDVNLHLKKNHPIEIIKNIIYSIFDKFGEFTKFENIDPIVSWQ